MFFRKSRYEKVKEYRFRRSDGSEVVIKQKRAMTRPKCKLIHMVQEGERSDLVAHRYYNDPLKFWKIADGNEEMNPESLFREPGRKILIPPNDHE